MKYTVTQDHFVTEFGVQLFAGDTFADGDAEPDLVANLVAQGIAVPDVPKSTKKAAAKSDTADE